MKIKVTQKDIDKGKAHSISFCPIALSLRRAYPEFKRIYVNGLDIRVGPFTFDSTRVIDAFIEKFDNKGPSAVKPTTFQLRRC